MASTNKKSKINSNKLEKSYSKSNYSFFDKIQSDLEDKQSLLSIVLGGMIVFVIGILIFNYFNKPAGEVGPTEETATESNSSIEDAKKDELPGKYTVKEGDTLFTIAEKYYDNGYKYPDIAKANNLADENVIDVGEVLNIPKLDQANAATTSLSDSAVSPSGSGEATSDNKPEEGEGMGGAENQTIWGEKITGDTYAVVEGDWLSKIAGRAYGDIYAYDKIAKANNIADPDSIEPGTVLKIPR